MDKLEILLFQIMLRQMEQAMYVRTLQLKENMFNTTGLIRIRELKRISINA